MVQTAFEWRTRQQDYPENYADPLLYDLYQDGVLLGTVSQGLKIFRDGWMLSSHVWHGWWGINIECTLEQAKQMLIEAATTPRAIEHRADIEVLRRGERAPAYGSEVSLWPKNKPLFSVTVRFNPEPTTRYYMTYQEAKAEFMACLVDPSYDNYGAGVNLARGHMWTADARYRYGCVIADCQMGGGFATWRYGTSEERTRHEPRMGPYGPY